MWQESLVFVLRILWTTFGWNHAVKEGVAHESRIVDLFVDDDLGKARYICLVIVWITDDFVGPVMFYGSWKDRGVIYDSERRGVEKDHLIFIFA